MGDVSMDGRECEEWIEWVGFEGVMDEKSYGLI